MIRKAIFTASSARTSGYRYNDKTAEALQVYRAASELNLPSVS